MLTIHSLVNARLLRRPTAVLPTTVLPSRPSRPEAAGSRVAGDQPRSADAGRSPSVSVLVPARNEVDRLGPTLSAILGQADVDLEVLVLDDASTDGTADLARTVAASDPRFRLLDGAPLPEGWLGKPFACWQLAQAATGDVLVFVDADVRLSDSAVTQCVAMLDRDGMDMLSPYPRQVAEGPAERLIQPLLQWSWLTFLPLRLAERAAAESLTAGNGQLIVCRRSAYDSAGGHQAVRAAVIEDVELARAFKRAGLQVGMADGTDLATCRMYDGWADLRTGYTKSLWAAFGGRGGAVAAVALLSGLYLVPPTALLLGLVRRRRDLVLAGATGYVAAVVGRVVAARRTGGRVADAPSHPASIALLIGLIIGSWRRRTHGTLTWKGRPV